MTHDAIHYDRIDYERHRSRERRFVVHATLRLTGCGDPTREELAAQLAGIGFDTIDIEEIA